jgi:hypothetical protein
MKFLHLIAFLALLVLVPLIAMQHGAVAAWTLAFVGGAVLAPWEPSAILQVTLTPTIILQKTIEAFRVRCPALAMFASDFTMERMKLDQQAIAHIRVMPTSSTYDANNGGYEAGAQESRDLLVDVPLTMDQHRHVTIKLSQVYALRDSKIKLEEHFRDSAEVLGKGVVDYMLGKANALNFSYETVETVANSDRDMLGKVRVSMNKRGASSTGRFGLVNTDVFEVLDADARITNRNYEGDQNLGGNPLGRLRNVAGFENILEYPDLPSNNATAVAITAEADDNVVTTVGAVAHGLVVGDRVTFPTLTGGTGLTAATQVYYVKAVPSASTLTVSLTSGGAVVDITVDASAGTIAKSENMTGFFGTRDAIAVKTGLPLDGIEAAQAFGIPTPVSSEIVTDPESGLSMVGYKWFKPGLMDAYMTIAFMYGAAAGKQGGATAGALLDKAGHIVRSL